MNSRLYECQVMHARFSPRPHRFLYRIFLFAIDLDELDTLLRRVPFFSVGRHNLYSFCGNDYLPTHEKLHGGKPLKQSAVALAKAGRDRDFQPTSKPLFEGRAGPPGPPTASKAGPAVTPFPGLKERVVAYLAGRGVDLAGGRVVLVTLPRVIGYLFNPVSFYFCYDRAGLPVAALAEVTNTFKEMKPYFLGPDTQAAARGEFRVRLPKHFYVSPYSDVDVAFDFTLRSPGDRLSIQIDDYIGAERTLTTILTGARRPLTGARLAWFTLKYPLLTLRIISLIHWHALLLWLKRVPWFAKAARAEDQRELYRPHASLVPAAAPADAASASPAFVHLQPTDPA